MNNSFSSKKVPTLRDVETFSELKGTPWALLPTFSLYVLASSAQPSKTLETANGRRPWAISRTSGAKSVPLAKLLGLRGRISSRQCSVLLYGVILKSTSFLQRFLRNN